MRALIQRVQKGSVTIAGRRVAEIDRGLVILLGVGPQDDEQKAALLARKIALMRIFEDEQGKMNLSVLDVKGAAIVVSQFTLLGDCRKGRRPGFDKAAGPDVAATLYNEFVDMLQACGVATKTGRFQAKMLLAIENDGPVTLVLDSRTVGT